jgi:putative Mn2+ efflux pump MntP
VTFNVTFVDWDGAVLKSATVESGKDATPPTDPKRSGHTFKGWDGSFENVKGDITVTAQYALIPVKEEPVKEEPVKEEPIKEEPAKEIPPVENPRAEEPVSEEEVITEDPVEEPIDDPVPPVEEPVDTPTPPAEPRVTSTDTPAEPDVTYMNPAPTVRVVNNPTPATPPAGQNVTINTPAPIVTVVNTPATPTEPSQVNVSVEPTEPTEPAAQAQQIGEVVTPLAGETEGTIYWAFINLVLILAGILVALITLLFITPAKKREEDEGERKNHPGIMMFALTAILAVAGIVLFLITEDVNRPLAMIDNWTAFNALILGLELVTMILAGVLTRKKKEGEESERPSTEHLYGTF